ncbi:kinase-like protein [Thelephora ganbajun]|uniref:Kinase-like protein n=1 Tax=Thelephora ganbajun TaxID=370292 RepID=A0ACB6ZN90_THEGA|nr:kinase-like protein [Thelephora ganbajun]
MASPDYQPDLQEEELEQTQQTQLSTQQYSQTEADQPDTDTHLWGFLLPCSPRLRQLDFWRMQPTYTIGRGHDNAIRLPGMRISNKHCIIRWDGNSPTSQVIVKDLSTNGTFINGVKIGQGNSSLLTNGSEIAFGSLHPQVQGDSLEDYRFVFRFTASGPPRDGLWAHYDVSHELGTGSFATVHKALSRRTGQFVAVKMIRSNKLASPLPADPNRDEDRSVNAATNNRSASFAREIQILSDLRHPNICQLIETFWSATEISEGNGSPPGDMALTRSGYVALVLELVEGGDLLEYILKHEGLDETASRFVTYQLCDALAYIHGQGVAHRDLKPENVLLTKDDPPVVKVADFGLAKYIDSLTMLKTMCGTPSYLAPEVVQNNVGGYGHGVDSWSVGVIVFSMLTLQSPFIENEDADIRVRIETRTTDWSMLRKCGISDFRTSFVGSWRSDPTSE